MKIRAGFVSNSSSSSFTCDVTGKEHDGEYEIDTCFCVNGHRFVSDFRLPELPVQIPVDKMRNRLLGDSKSEKDNLGIQHASDDQIQSWYADYSDESEYEDDDLPPKLCPICSFKFGRTKDLLVYMLKRDGLTEEKLLTEIQKKFGGDYQTFQKVMRPQTNLFKKRIRTNMSI